MKLVGWLRRKIPPRQIIYGIPIILLVVSAYCMAQTFRVIETYPKPNSIIAGAGDSIVISFSNPVDLASVNSATVKIVGAYHGFYNFAFQAANPQALQLHPLPNFYAGESITIILTADVIAANGTPLLPYTLNFQTRNTQGNILGGAFRSEIPLFSIDKQPVKIAVGDFDENGFPDAAVVNSVSGSLTILRNTISGPRINLVAEQSYPTGTTPLDLAVADFDRDNHLDIAVVNYHSNNVTIYWGDGNFQFQSTSSFDVGIRPASIATSDFNGDGLIDFAVALEAENKLIIFENVGSRNFIAGAELNCEEGTQALASGDLDGDGDPDLAAINAGAYSVSFFQNNEFANWQALPSLTVPPLPEALVWANIRGNNGSLPGDTLAELIVLSSPLSTRSQPMNKVHSEESNFSVFKYNSNTNAMELVQTFSYNSIIRDFAAANMDYDPSGDQDIDLLMLDYEKEGSLQYLVNQNNSGWDNPVQLDTSNYPNAIVTADFDLDGDNDILYAEHLKDRLVLLLSPPGIKPPPVCLLGIINFGGVFVGDTSMITGITDPNTLDVDVDIYLPDTLNFDIQPMHYHSNPGEADTLSFFFFPQDTFLYDTAALVHTSHPLQEDCFIVLIGQGLKAIIAVEPDSLDFGNVPPGFDRTLSVNIRNRGNGTLTITQWENSILEFTFDTNPLDILPKTEMNFPIKFSPMSEGVYRDTLFIHSNDLDSPVIGVILKGTSIIGRPTITSADTITAIEHQPFSYTATAIDPEGEPISFQFRNLAHWLQAQADSVFGTPPEGAIDTTFRIIASDGFLKDTLDVYVIVIPVNDPPSLAPISPITIEELSESTFTATATDPENEPLNFFADNLPAWITFGKGNNSATFQLKPPFLSAGEYTVGIRAVETISNPALSDSIEVKITVTRKKPDLVVNSLKISDNNIYLSQSAAVSAIIENREAPVLETFKVQLRVGNDVVFDTTCAGMDVDQSFSISARKQFNSLGRIPITAVADVNGEVSEVTESNNIRQIFINVEQGNLIARPNPFTPNGDNKNDRVTFDLKQLFASNPSMKIFDINGRKVRTLTDIQNNQLQWDGYNDSGQEQLPGVYLYLLQDGSKTLAKGYVVLAR